MPRSMRDRRMRDMARRRQDMRDRRRDMRSMRDMRYDMANSNRYARSEYDSRYGDYNYSQSDYARGRMGSQSGREYDRHYEYPYMNDYNYDYARNRRTGRYIKDRRDYGESEEYLSDEELMEWQKDLEEEIDPQYRPMFEKNRVIQRAKEMGVNFKEFTEDEYVTTVMMIASDFGRTVGMNDTDKIYRMAFDFLDDKDAGVRGSEKLAVYYDEIVCAE